ncbi:MULTISPECIES: sulfite exporter TauE/SafE family protein [unclassified Microbulbifer]|uniref:sulfite exporter TauE/SafE family protein n=1 Tax=unclassified Microbulbifer TaxID=2619833 RepID=UPI0027E4FBFE|nr:MULTISPECIES: sulfite exporter TauE/SafE family protein [unclassified Microbulbifer]
MWMTWLAAFYAVWAFLVFGLDNWQMAKEHWPMALAMALGSYAAGSTPMGGGTVGFPVLVLLFDTPASLGRDFSFAVQAIGMVSASFFLLARRQPLAGNMLKGAMLGSLLGTPLGIQLIAPLVPELWIKLVFAVVWGSFGILHLYRLREITAHSGSGGLQPRRDFRIGFALGAVAGATAVSVTGVGIDMVIYAALVLLCRVDLKIAIPTSVVIMAFNSVVGVVVKSVGGGWHPEVYGNWLAAAPVVILGAPLGVFIVSLIDRKLTLLIVALLCVGQLVWTFHAERAALGSLGLLASLSAVGLCLLVFEWLRKLGSRLAGANAFRAAEELQSPDKVLGSGLPLAS